MTTRGVEIQRGASATVKTSGQYGLLEVKVLMRVVMGAMRVVITGGSACVRGEVLVEAEVIRVLVTRVDMEEAISDMGLAAGGSARASVTFGGGDVGSKRRVCVS